MDNKLPKGVKTKKMNNPSRTKFHGVETVHQVFQDGKHIGYAWQRSQDTNVMSGRLRVGTSTRKGWHSAGLDKKPLSSAPQTYGKAWVIHDLIRTIERKNLKKEETTREDKSAIMGFKSFKSFMTEGRVVRKSNEK